MVSTRPPTPSYGCFHHGHSCNENHDGKKWQKTIQCEAELRGLGYYTATEPSNTSCRMENIINAVKCEEPFGFIQCHIHLPLHFIEKCSEFPPIFKNTEISMADIGEYMQAHCRNIARKSCVKRSLISSMSGENILLLIPLLKKYLEMSLVMTNIEFVIEYNGKCVFEWFINEVVNDRRMSDPEYTVRGETSKTKGKFRLWTYTNE